MLGSPVENALGNARGHPSALADPHLPTVNSAALIFKVRVGLDQRSRRSRLIRAASPGPCGGHRWSPVEIKITFRNSVALDGLRIDHLNLVF